MPALEFTVPQDDLARLYRLPAFRRRAGRAAAADLVWHDTAASELAAEHLSLCNAQTSWRLERASPVRGELCLPGTPPRVIAEGGSCDAVGPMPMPGPLMPVAGFRGERRVLAAGSVDAAVTVLHGTIRGMAQERPACRITLEGPAPALTALSGQLADAVQLEIPRWSLATEAAAFARGWPPSPRQQGGPAITPGTNVGDALAIVAGHLTDVILAGVPAASAGETAEPVHAMRVAVRRLRSALSVFRKVADGPARQALKPQLQRLGVALGESRDWDVFLAGTGQDVAAALPDDRRIAAVLAAAAKRRALAYAGLRRTLGSGEFRSLMLDLVLFAALRPWQETADEGREERLAALSANAEAYGAHLLRHRYAQMLEAGADIAEMPAPELHELRKQGKRLRYAAEFFAPCYGRRSTRRFVRGVSQLQEGLGHLNDGAAAGHLMEGLRGGPDTAFARGVVQGFAAAQSTGCRAIIGERWAKFRRLDRFWE